MSKHLSFDARLFEDLNQHLTRLGVLFTSSYAQKSKDETIQMMIQEARIQSFLDLHNALNDFFVSVYTRSEFEGKQASKPDEAVGYVLNWFFKEKMLTKEQANSIVEQYESSMILSYDRIWLEKDEERKLFDERAQKISRYYYTISTFVGQLTSQVQFSKSEKPHVTE